MKIVSLLSSSMFGILNNNIQLYGTDIIMPNSNVITGNCLYVNGQFGSFLGSLSVGDNLTVAGTISNPGIISTAPYTSITGNFNVGSALTVQGTMSAAALKIMSYASVSGDIVAGSMLIAVGTIVGTALQVSGPFASCTGNVSVGSALNVLGTITGTSLQVIGPFASVSGNISIGSSLVAATLTGSFLKITGIANISGVLTSTAGTGGVQVANVTNPSVQLTSTTGTLGELGLVTSTSSFSSSATLGDVVLRSVGGGRVILNTGNGSAAITCVGTMVGINNANPLYSVHINGDACATGSNTAVYQVSSPPLASGFSSFSALTDNGSSTILFQNGSARQSDGGTLTSTIRNNSGGDMRIVNANSLGITVKGLSGFIGVAQTNPIYQLDVGGLARINNAYLGSISTSMYVSNQFQIGTLTTGYALFQGFAGNTAINSALNQPMLFNIANAEVMRLTSGGLLGLGISTPTYKFDCAGTGRFTGSVTISNSSTPALYLYSSGNNTRLNIDAASGQQSGISFQSGGSEVAVLYRPSSSLDMRLSSTGYGDTMTWTSGGLCGIRNTSPAYSLDVNGTVRTGDIRVSGTAYCAGNAFVSGAMTVSGAVTAPSIALPKLATTPLTGLVSELSNDKKYVSEGANVSVFNNDKMYIQQNSSPTLGVVTISNYLYVNSYFNYGSGNQGFSFSTRAGHNGWDSGGGSYGGGAVNINPSIQIQSDFVSKGGGIFLFSDKRFKTNIRSCDRAAACNVLSNLEVVDFNRKDYLTQGIHSRIGFLAQDVQQAFPEATGVSAGFLPDIYEWVECQDILGGSVTVTLSTQAAALLNTGARLQVGMEMQLFECYVTSKSDNVFYLSFDERNLPKVSTMLIIGTHVSDILSVDHTKIFTLNVLVTQALQKENKQLKSLLEKLSNRIGHLENKIL